MRPILIGLLLVFCECSCTSALLPGYVLPKPDHIVVVFMENHNYLEIIDTIDAPFIHALEADSNTAFFTNSYALGHPSQPNYIMFFSGDNQGVINNDRPSVSFKAPNLAAQLEEAGFTFTTYSEDLPYVGFDGDTIAHYVRKHNPVTNWMGTAQNQVDSNVNQPFTAFPTNYNDLPTVSFVIPNLINDMHDGTIAQGDTWLQTYFAGYIEWAKNNNSLFILTFDEGSYAYDGDHIITLFTGDHVKGGYYDTYINHYTILRTIQDLYALKHAGYSRTHFPISECWD